MKGDLAVGAIKTRALTVWFEDGFTGYTVTCKIVPSTGSARTLTGTIDGTDPQLCHFATVSGDLAVEGTYQCQVILDDGAGEVFPTAPFSIYVHPAI